MFAQVPEWKQGSGDRREIDARKEEKPASVRN
jgi:hypothetical protein